MASDHMQADDIDQEGCHGSRSGHNPTLVTPDTTQVERLGAKVPNPFTAA